MIADMLYIFPSFTYEFIMKKISFKQFILFHLQALRLMSFQSSGKITEIELNEQVDIDKELSDINNKFIKNPITGRWE